jgi:hypothetical protein
MVEQNPDLIRILPEYDRIKKIYGSLFNVYPDLGGRSEGLNPPFGEG